MDDAEIRSSLAEPADTGLIHQGLVDYLRDYEMYFYLTSYDAQIIPFRTVRYLFRCCVVAQVETSLPTSTWKKSLDEINVHGSDIEELEGWDWSVRYADMYPGAKLVDESSDAARWTAEIGIPFREVRIAAAPLNIRLVFSDLEITEAEPGFAPFVVPGLEDEVASSRTITPLP
ncbi:MAG: hypothetical protein JWQ39_2669 [Glaciihabitans sp.]|nr:hypothetical protein [Glaciihabitans sp.]